MSDRMRQEIQRSLQRHSYHFEGYPEWYNQELATGQAIPLSRFQGDLHTAIYFYQKQAQKLHFANHVLKFQLEAVLKEIRQLTEMIQQVQSQENSSADEKKKRVRRCASQIERKYICPVSSCQKSYGTEGSMAQHMRLKHPGVSYVMADLNPDVSVKEEQSDVKKEQRPLLKQ